MSNQEQAALKQAAVEFVRKVVTEIYGQRATKTAVSATARRVIATLPTSPSGDNGQKAVSAIRADG